MSDVMRCLITSNPCGTDSWAMPCKCKTCQQWILEQLTILTQERDALREAVKICIVIAKRLEDSRCGRMAEAYPGMSYGQRVDEFEQDQRALEVAVLAILSPPAGAGNGKEVGT